MPQSWGDAISTGIRRTVLQPVLWMQGAAEEGRTSRARFRAVDGAAGLRGAGRAERAGPARRKRGAARGCSAWADRLAPAYVAAEVLHQPLPTDGRTLLLSVGRSAGVRPVRPVVAPGGLVGVVRAVEGDHSIAMTWAHPDFRVSALTAGRQRLRHRGRGAGLDAGRDDAGAARGALSRFAARRARWSSPPGWAGSIRTACPIGTVIGVVREEPGWERTYLLRPAANPLGRDPRLVLLAPPGPVGGPGLPGGHARHERRAIGPDPAAPVVAGYSAGAALLCAAAAARSAGLPRISCSSRSLVYAIRSRPGDAAIAGFLVGLPGDALVPGRFGAGALANTVVGYLTAWGRAVFFADNLIVNAAVFAGGLWLRDLIMLVASGASGRRAAATSWESGHRSRP